MCIVADDTMQVIKNGQLKLWKVIRQDNVIGIWGNTRRRDYFKRGLNLADEYTARYGTTLPCKGRLHCFFTREEARDYYRRHKIRAISWADDRMANTKIIRVFADSKNVVSVGVDKETGIRAISVSKMTIKSLKHQR